MMITYHEWDIQYSIPKILNSKKPGQQLEIRVGNSENWDKKEGLAGAHLEVTAKSIGRQWICCQRTEPRKEIKNWGYITDSKNHRKKVSGNFSNSFIRLQSCWDKNLTRKDLDQFY